MGGYGSGWHGGTGGRPPARGTVADARVLRLRGMRPYIDAAERRRAEGHVGRATAGTWGWTRDGETVASVGFALDVDAEKIVLALDYTFGSGGRSVGLPVTVRVPLDTTLGNGGGVRYWMRCPGLPDKTRDCGRRCGALYLPGGAHRFACRLCHGLTYESCRESRRFDSLFRRLAAQMGTDPREVKRALSRSHL